MITDIVLRISGTVDFTDGTTQRFGATYQDGALVEPSASDSQEAFKQLWRGRHTDITALLNLLGGSHVITTGAPSAAKEVAGWSFLFDGTVSNSDGSSGSFNAVYDAMGGSRVSGASVYVSVLADSAYKAVVDSLMEAVACSGKVSIAA